MITSLKRRVLAYRTRKRQFFLGKKRGIAVYEFYFFAGGEKLVHVGIGIGVVVLFAFFFYRSLWAGLLLWPIGVKCYFSMQKEKGGQCIQLSLIHI